MVPNETRKLNVLPLRFKESGKLCRAADCLESGIGDHFPVPVGAALGDARLALVVDIDNAEAL